MEEWKIVRTFAKDFYTEKWLMKADRQYIEKKFEEFNRQMFAGKLPPIPIELSDAKSFLGQWVFKIRRTLFGKTEKYDFRLRINTRIDLPEQDIEDTIIHEMIHYYIGVNQLKDTSAHGQIFRQIVWIFYINDFR